MPLIDPTITYGEYKKIRYGKYKLWLAKQEPEKLAEYKKNTTHKKYYNGHCDVCCADFARLDTHIKGKKHLKRASVVPSEPVPIYDATTPTNTKEKK